MIRIVALILLLAPHAFAQSLSANQIRNYLLTNSDKSLLNVSTHDARYPVVQIIKAFQSDQKDADPKTIATLESLFQRTEFHGSIQSVESYGLWRDLAYLTIARAYYEQNKINRSLTYLRGIADDSPFKNLARTQKIWDLIRIKRFGEAKTELKKTGKSNLSPGLSKEYTLQRAVVAIKQKHYEFAARTAKSIQFTAPALEDIRMRILAESLFRIYLKKINLHFNESKLRLQNVLKYANQISSTDQDARLAYFMADVQWHLASVYRIKDPVAYAAKADAHLSIADKWLTPWIENSVRLKKPLLPQEAMFLSSIVLWEQKKYEVAIPRLLLTIRFYPHTQYKEDIYQLIGDYYFNHEKFHKAVDAYRLLAESGDVEKAGYGIYKAAWAFYNLKEKFKALRHLERLVLFYQKYPTVKDDAGLQGEALHDMLFMLTELMPAKAALREFRIFDFDQSQLEKVEAEVAAAYHKIGRFNDSIFVYKSLLKSYPKDKQYYTWLGILLQTELDAGQRLAISQSLDQFIGTGTVPHSFKKIAVNLQLTIHHEANKTSDPVIWKATDALYDSMAQHFPHLKFGDFWYFGAQRKQQLGHTSQALKWYSKAALISKYENAQDAAVTILQILNTIESHDGITSAPTPSVQKEIVQWSKWYIDHFDNSPQIAACDHLYIEGLLNLNKYSDAAARVERVVARDPKDHKQWLNYLYLNDELYHANRWNDSFHLAKALLKINGNSAKHIQLLKDFRGESAFQVAYNYDKNKSVKKARRWYRTAIRVGVHQSVILKSWHNLILTYKQTSHLAQFEKIYHAFLKQKPDGASLSLDDKKLCADIHEFAADFFRAHSQMDNRFRALSRAANFVDPQNALPLRWSALTGFGAYYDRKNFESELAKWQALKPNPTAENQVLLAKIYFWLGNYQKSWSQLLPLLEKNPPEDSWLLVRDLYVTAARDQDLKSLPVVDWLKKHSDVAKTQPSLEGIWSRLKWQKLKAAVVASVNLKTVQREPQNVPTAKKSNDGLTTRLKMVADILRSMAKTKQRLTALFIKDSPQITVASLCQMPKATTQAIDQLSKLDLKPLAGPEWPGFSSRLQAKIAQLKRVKTNESQTCKTKSLQIADYEPLNYSLTQCFEKTCPVVSSVSTTKIEDIDKHMPPSATNALKRAKAFAKMGAWATAQYWADQLSDNHERALVLGYLRIVWRDPWTAYSLLQNAAKDPALAPQAHQLLQDVAAAQ